MSVSCILSCSCELVNDVCFKSYLVMTAAAKKKVTVLMELHKDPIKVHGCGGDDTVVVIGGGGGSRCQHVPHHG